MLPRRTIEISVGLFVIIGLTSLFMLALKVSGLNDVYQSVNGYSVTAEFSNVGDLKTKAKVSVGGVVVGRVTKIELDPDEFIAKVRIFISDNYRNIPADSRASILTAGLLGDNFIGLAPGFDEEFLTDGSIIPPENTASALQLEDLISKFVANRAINTDKPGDE